MTILGDPNEGDRCSSAEWQRWRLYIDNLEREGGEEAIRGQALEDVRALLDDAETVARITLGDELTPEVVARVAGLLADRERDVRRHAEPGQAPDKTAPAAAPTPKAEP